MPFVAFGGLETDESDEDMQTVKINRPSTEGAIVLAPQRNFVVR